MTTADVPGTVAHLDACDSCGFAGICPWDRYCSGCGASLAEGFSVTQSISVGRDKDAVSVVLLNKSRVVVTVHAPPIFQHQKTNPPDWLDYSAYPQGQWKWSLDPGEQRVVEYNVRRGVLDQMLQEQSTGQKGRSKAQRGNRATSFELLVCSDADYTHQDHLVRLSLSGQADLRPARLEFPLLPLSTTGAVRLPFKAYNASGQAMRVHNVRISAVSSMPALRGDDSVGRSVVETLFPPDVFAALLQKEIGPGATIELDITSRPFAEALKAFTLRLEGPLYDDPYWQSDRFSQWLWRWPRLVRLRFVVEAELRSVSGDDNSVRSLVVLTLVRPPSLRDATPEDALWKVVSSQGELQAKSTYISTTGEGTLIAAADLINDSAIPVVVRDVRSTVPWMTVRDAPTGKSIAPGQGTIINVVIDPSKRATADLQEQHLEGHIEVDTVPPLCNPRLEPVVVKTSSTLVVPGCLGIDFGTSNCSVCFLPGGDWPGGSPILLKPIELNLERLQGTQPTPGMPSILWRRYTSQPQYGGSSFAFGTEASQLWQSRPSNVRRAIKRVLSTPDKEHAFEVDNHANPVVRLKTKELAEKMISHVILEAQRLAATSPELKEMIARLAKEAETANMTGFPTPGEVGQAEAYRFERAVFTHPVDANENLRRLLFDAARAAGLADRVRLDGTREPHTFETFEADCMVDEATAAMTMFVDEFKTELRGGRSSGGRRGRRQGRSNRGDKDPGLLVVGLDIGGGTADISVMRYVPKVRRVASDGAVSFRPQLHLLNRVGVNNFAGEDLDLRIVERILVPSLNAKLQTVAPGAKLMMTQFRAVLQGASSGQIVNGLEKNMLVSDRTEAERMAASVVKGAHLLRDSAENLKKAAAEGGDLSFVLNRMPPFVLGHRAQDDAELVNVNVKVALSEVSAVVQELVTSRLSAIDGAVTAANRNWAAVDVLLFTGQTTRSPDVRHAILSHVRTQRETPLKFVVVPPSNRDPVDAPPADRASRSGHEGAPATAGLGADIATIVLEFDPKVCVPGGAAIYGSIGTETDRLEVVRARRSGVTIVGSRGEARRIGTPLPVFIPVDVDFDSFEADYAVDNRQVVVNVDSLPDDVDFLSIVLVGPETAFLVGSRSAGVEPDESGLGEANGTPSELAAAVAELDGQRARYLEIDPKAPMWWMVAPLTKNVLGR